MIRLLLPLPACPHSSVDIGLCHLSQLFERFLFSFEQEYIEDPNRPTLSLSFKGQAGGLVVPTRAVTARLPVFFSNLLPEGHLREYLSAHAGVKPQPERDHYRTGAAACGRCPPARYGKS